MLTNKLLCQPGRGLLELTDATIGNVAFSPFLDVYGMDSFFFIATDEEGAESGPQIGTIDISATNSKPIARNITLQVEKS